MQTKLEKAFAKMEERGIIARQNWFCCQTCGVDAMRGLLKAAPSKVGYCFYHAQDAEDLKRSDGMMHLAFGGVCATGQTICICLEQAGIEYEWGGDSGSRIGIKVESLDSHEAPPNVGAYDDNDEDQAEDDDEDEDEDEEKDPCGARKCDECEISTESECKAQAKKESESQGEDDRFVPRTKIEKPVVKLVGSDGNAFAVMGKVARALRSAKVPPEVLKAYQNESMGGDYDNLLATAMRYAEVR